MTGKLGLFMCTMLECGCIGMSDFYLLSVISSRAADTREVS